MKFLNWIAQYNKALVPVTMAVVYYLNTKYGIDIPIKESDAVIIWMTISGFITWAVPNKKLK